MGPVSGDSSLNMENYKLKKKEDIKKLFECYVKHLSNCGLLKISWRCLLSLGLMLIKEF